MIEGKKGFSLFHILHKRSQNFHFELKKDDLKLMFKNQYKSLTLVFKEIYLEEKYFILY